MLQLSLPVWQVQARRLGYLNAHRRQPLPRSCVLLACVQGVKKPSSSRLAAASGRMDFSASPMRQKDKVLSAVRAYQVLKPDQRKSLLTDKVGSLLSLDLS